MNNPLVKFNLSPNSRWKTVKVNGKERQVPQGWEISNLTSICELINGSAFKPDELNQHNLGLPVVRIQNLTNIKSNYSFYNISEGEKKVIIDKGDILFAWSGTIDCFIFSGEKSLLNQHIFKVMPKDGMSKQYLFNIIKFNLSNLKKIGHGLAMTHITLGNLKNFFFTFPTCVMEQNAIAKIISVQNDIICRYNEVLVKEKVRLNYLMDNLLSGKYRVRSKGKDSQGEDILEIYKNEKCKTVKVNGKDVEIPEEWDVKILSDISTVKTSSVDKIIRDDEKLVDLLNYMDVYKSKRHIVELGMNFSKTSINIQHLSSNFVKKGDIFFTPSSETKEDIAHAAVAMNDFENLVYSYHLIRVRPNKDVFDPLFSSKFFNHSFSRSYFTSRAQGLTRMTLSKKAFESFEVFVPSFKEQERIGFIIDQQEKIIIKQEEMIFLEQKRLEWLMDNLLTGKYLVQAA